MKPIDPILARFQASAARILGRPFSIPKPRRSKQPSRSERLDAVAKHEGKPRARAASKRCPRCKEPKPLTLRHWHRCRSSADGFQGICKVCQRTRAESRRQVQREPLEKRAVQAVTRAKVFKAKPVQVAPADDDRGPPSPGREADACARLFRTYEREERERRAYTPGGARIAGVANAMPSERPFDVWTAEEQAALDWELDELFARLPAGALEQAFAACRNDFRARLLALGWNGVNGGIPDEQVKDDEEAGEEDDTRSDGACCENRRASGGRR